MSPSIQRLWFKGKMGSVYFAILLLLGIGEVVMKLDIMGARLNSELSENLFSFLSFFT
jgi:hypothetical protein